MRPVIAIVLGAVACLPCAARAEEAASLVTALDAALDARPVARCVADGLFSRGHRLIAESEILEVTGGPLEAEPPVSALEGWAAALEAELVVLVFLEPADAGRTGVRAVIHVAEAHISRSTSAEADAGTTCAVARALVLDTLDEIARQIVAEAQRRDSGAAARSRLRAGETPSEVDAALDSEQPPPPLEEQEDRSRGRAPLVLNTTFFGLSMTTGLLFAADVRDPRLFGPLLLLGGAAGLATGFLIHRRWRVCRGDNAVVAAGGWYGAATGLLVAGTLGLDDARWLITGGLVGQVLGLTVGVVAAAFTDIPAGDGAVVHSGGSWGLALGGIVALLVVHDDPRTSYGLVLAGLGAGILAGGLTSAFTEASSGRVAIIDLFGLLGSILGATAGLPLLIDDQNAGHTRGYAGILLGTAAAGIGLGVLLTRNWEQRARDRSERSRRHDHGRSGSISFAPVPTVIPPAPSAPRSGVGFGVQLVGGTW